MYLYDTIHNTQRQNAHTGMSIKDLKHNMFTLTALVALVSMTGFPTFRADEFHTLEESVCFHIEADKIPHDVRCTCLQRGRFCLNAEHWLLEFGPGSLFWLDEYGKPRSGSLIRYTGLKKGGRSVTVGDFQERICCVEGFGEAGRDLDSSSLLTG